MMVSALPGKNTDNCMAQEIHPLTFKWSFSLWDDNIKKNEELL